MLERRAGTSRDRRTDSPDEFSVLPAEILGPCTKQFLGKVIRHTSGGHRAVV